MSSWVCHRVPALVTIRLCRGRTSVLRTFSAFGETQRERRAIRGGGGGGAADLLMNAVVVFVLDEEIPRLSIHRPARGSW